MSLAVGNDELTSLTILILSNSHYEDVSLTNFFLDRDIIPIEINFDRDVTKSELCDIFESIKSKIGPPYNYGLSQEEQEEINKLKTEIAREEAAEKAEEERMKAIAARDGEEKEIENWVWDELVKLWFKIVSWLAFLLISLFS